MAGSLVGKSLIPVIHVGVISHQPLHATEGLKPALTNVLATIAAGAREIANGNSCWMKAAPIFRCILSLHDTADCWFAEAAFELGYEVCVILPRPRSEYASAETDALLARATAMFELGGDAAQAKQDAGTILLDQADILLVCGEGLPAHSSSPSAALIRSANDRAIPVAAVDCEQPGADWREPLRREIARLLLPAASPAHDRSLQTLFSPAEREARWASRVCTYYERLMLLGAVLPTPDPAGGSQPAAPGFDRADRLAVDYGNRYRAAGILRLSVLLLSILGVFLGFYGTVLSLPQWGATLGFMLQVAALAGVLWLSYANERRAWHAKFLDFRHVAEQLRFAGILARLGTTPPSPRPPPFQPDHRQDWAGWYVRSTVRAAGLANARVTPEYIDSVRNDLCDQIDGQISFYQRRSQKFQILARRLDRLANACFWAGLGVVVLRAALYFAWPGNAKLQTLANMSTLVVPALAPIFLGLRAQGEYARLSQRYLAMASQLRSVRADLTQPGLTFGALAANARRTVSTMLAEVTDWRSLIQARSIPRM